MMENYEVWKTVLNNSMKFKVATKVTPTKGKLVYEYNPLRNYRLSEDKYLYKKQIYSEKELFDKFNISLTDEGWKQNSQTLNNPPTLYQKKGQLTDFISSELNLSLLHPITILPQYSYDGSVDLIINDGINTPKLINTRFSATGKNTYEIIDRKGNNDTNIYDEGEQFNTDTSLYKRVNKIPKINFIDVRTGGNLKVGNYHFYFKLSDTDGNETDFIGESGLVSVYVGYNDPRSVHTGSRDENSLKSVKFVLSDIDSSYDYVQVYYSRNSAELDDNSITQYFKIDKKYLVNLAQESIIVIDGFENTINVSNEDINLFYMTVDSAQASTICQNMLFLGNVHKPRVPYEELQDLSLRFLPYVKEEIYPLEMDHNYYMTSMDKGYYDPKFIYNKVGYWNNEFYRFGIVYIMPNGELTPVFNIRGRYGVKPFNGTKNGHNDGQYSEYFVYVNNKRNIIKIKEESNYIIDPNSEEGEIALNKSYYENAKGVVTFDSDKDTDVIYSLDIRVSTEVINELKKYVKGYFFVRQKRIPTILAQGVTIGIDKESHTPTIPTAEGFLSEIQNEFKNTFIESKDINDVNYISEGFLNRYSFDLVPTKHSIWGKIGKAMLSAVAVTVAIVGTAMFFPPLAPVVGHCAGSLGIAAGFYTSAAALTIAAGAAAGVATGVGMSVVGATKELINVVKRTSKTVTLSGRNEKVPDGMKRKETKKSRQISEDFYDRIIIKDDSSNKPQALLCPEYEVNQALFNQIFTGNEHIVQPTISQNTNALRNFSSSFFSNDKNHFYIPSYYDNKQNINYKCKIISIPDNTKLIGIDNYKFRSRAGEAEEAWRYESVSEDYKSNFTKNTKSEDEETLDNKQINSDIIRGSFGPYLGITNYPNVCETVNILIPGYSENNIPEYIELRMNDYSPFMAISDRFDIFDENYLFKQESYKSWNLYRGDCYLCQFTHRLNRNFNDPSAPYNDLIVDLNTWKDNYNVTEVEKQSNINLGDVNAVKLGMWVTFRVRSSLNLNIRTLDDSDINETAMTGHPKGYFPYFDMLTDGTYKTPDSNIFNKGFSKDLSERVNFEVPDVPTLKNWFKTRIIYSDVRVNDSFKNGFRVFQGNHYQDYTREYGEIIKLITLNSNILCIFEHGVAIIPIKERAIAGEGAGGNIYINTSNVLPETPKIISDVYGSQWADSVLKVPAQFGNNVQYVYGVDTVAKKIWRTDGNSLECISDFKVQEFLNNNITLGERELNPIIGVRNVKTMYNSFKHDVLFTFYDNTYGFQEKVWNLCWNEILQKFITFYSWVPSMMENINNIPFSFNRDTAKWIAKLGVSHSESSFADGIVLSNNIISKSLNIENYNQFIGYLDIKNRIIPENYLKPKITFSLEDDTYHNNDYFIIDQYKEKQALFLKAGVDPKILYSELYYRNKAGNSYSDDDSNKIQWRKNTSVQDEYFDYPIFKDKSGKRLTLSYDNQINPDKIVRLLNIRANISFEIESNDLSDDFYNMKAGYENNNSLIDAGYYKSTIAIIPEWNIQFLNTDFWKHGCSGIFDISDKILPTYWYGKQHPFEFECVVMDNPMTHKIFTNIELIANKAQPESFHYEIIGEVYDFAKDKPNMYFRQEALKSLWQYNGADISYNKDFVETQVKQQNKSADIIHKYVSKIDTINEVEDYYKFITNPKGYNYNHLSGGEIVYYPNRQEYRIQNHAQAIDLNDLDQNNPRSIIQANCQYLEDRWRITINPLLICYKNEYKNLKEFKDSTWVKSKNNSSLLPTLPIYNSQLPEGVLKENIQVPEQNSNHPLAKLYDNLSGKQFLDFSNWTKSRKEVDLKDKFIKVKIRYSGKELVIINMLNTIYKISHA